MTPSRARIKTMTRLSLLDTCDQISNFFQFVARQCPPRVMGDNKTLASRLRQIRDVAGSVAVGTVGGLPMTDELLVLLVAPPTA